MMGHPVINTHSHHQTKNRTQTRASNKHRLLCGWGGCLVTKEADSSAGWVQGGGCVWGQGLAVWTTGQRSPIFHR